MAQFTLTFPDAIQIRVVAGLTPDWTAELGAAMGMTRAQMARKRVIEWVRQQVAANEMIAAEQAARNEARTTAESQIIIT